jgi:hypothetical protein
MRATGRLVSRAASPSTERCRIEGSRQPGDQPWGLYERSSRSSSTAARSSLRGTGVSQYHARSIADLGWFRRQIALVVAGLAVPGVPRRKWPLWRAAFTVALLVEFRVVHPSVAPYLV